MIGPRQVNRTDSPLILWAAFSIFLVASALLSYFPLPGGIKWGIGFVGIFLPFITLLLYSKPAVANEKLPCFQSPRLNIPTWVWAFLLALAVFTRTFHLTSLSGWPMPDDGLFGFYSLELSQKWSWHYFYTHSQQPAFFTWCLGFFFKWVTPSLLSLWFFPALVSCATMMVLFVLSRFYFSGLFAFLFMFLLSTSFGMNYLGRFCNNYVMVSFWEALVVLALVLSLKSPPHKRLKWAFALGAFTGAGFFVSISWVVIAFAVSLSIIFRERDFKNEKLIFFLPLLVLGCIFILLFLRDANIDHMRALFLFRGGWKGYSFIDSLACLGGLFFGTGSKFNYGPVWGGILNPLVDSGFFLGLLECLRFRRSPFIRWISLSFLLLLTPGLLTTGLDFFRIAPALPLGLLIAALGFQKMAESTGVKGGKIFLRLVLAISFSLDLYHFLGPYHDLWGTPNPEWYRLKSAELMKADGILERARRESGPGMILSDLRPNASDQTLTIATYGFDTARNPEFTFEDSRWAAVIVAADEKGELDRRFPGGKWYWLGRDYVWGQDMTLGLLPVTDGDKPALKIWYEMNRTLQPLTSEGLNLFTKEERRKIIDQTVKTETQARGDPFLETCLWEKVAFLSLSDKNDAEGLGAVQTALKRGYSLAHLFNLEGVLLNRMGRRDEAKTAFRKAMGEKLNFSPARQNLASLENTSKPLGP